MKTNIVHTGDSAIILKGFEPDSIDLTVTSPPYDNLRAYKGYSFEFEAIAKELYRVTKPGGVVVWVVGDATVDGSETLTSFRQALYFQLLGFNVHDTMIYQTDKPPMNDNRYQACFEYMFVFSKGKPNVFNPIKRGSRKAGTKRKGTTYREQNNTLKNQWRGGLVASETILESIWYFPTGGVNVGHPAPFPEDLAKNHILTWSKPGDIVLDCFAGSGTTLAMAKILSRKYIGIEISPEYVEIIRRRLSASPSPLFAEAAHNNACSGQGEGCEIFKVLCWLYPLPLTPTVSWQLARRKVFMFQTMADNERGTIAIPCPQCNALLETTLDKFIPQNDYILGVRCGACKVGFTVRLEPKVKSQLTPPAPDKGDSPASEKSTTP